MRYDDLRLMDGMRVMCLLWIMMMGVSQFTMSSAVYNPWTLFHYFQTYGYTAVLSSNLGFDEFFFFTGILLTLKLKERLVKERSFSVFKYAKLFFMRYVRLAPVYYMIFLIGWQIGPQLGEGPVWFTYEKGFYECN